MHRVLSALGAALFVVVAIAFSKQSPGTSTAPTTSELTITSESRNPWTHLRLNNDAEQFQFVVLSDRTGGHREKVFSRAVGQINLLQPEFVMSVGDLIEGYTKNDERIDTEWREFQTYASKFDMPFFYVPGNHDLTNKTMAQNWGNRFGRAYYHFLYKDVLFLAVNSEDPVTKISAEQTEYFKKALAANPKARWTMVFLHKPLWVDAEKTGWKGIEEALAGRNYTVFCGHVHRYQKYIRNGMNYYQLATTGGGSKLRGVKFGEFDHVVWITMKKDGPVLANVMLDGIYPEDLAVAASEEQGAIRKLERTFPTRVTVYFDGSPAVGATVAFNRAPQTASGSYQVIADGFTTGDGTADLSSFTAFDGAPAGEYVVTVTMTGKYRELGEPNGKNLLPQKYASGKTSPLKVTVKADEKNNFVLDLSR